MLIVLSFDGELARLSASEFINLPDPSEDVTVGPDFAQEETTKVMSPPARAKWF
jgi:hypothetical protein